MNEELQNVTEATNEVVSEVSKTGGFSKGTKIGLCVAGTLATLGIGYGVYKFIKNRKQKKQAEKAEEQNVVEVQ